MLRIPRLTEEVGEEDDVSETESPGLSLALTSALSRSTTSNFSGLFGGRTNSMKQSNRRESIKLRGSVKVNLRSTETSLKLKNLALLSK